MSYLYRFLFYYHCTFKLPKQIFITYAQSVNLDSLFLIEVILIKSHNILANTPCFKLVIKTPVFIFKPVLS